MIYPKYSLAAGLLPVVLSSLISLSALPDLEAQSASRRPKPQPAESAATPTPTGNSSVRFWKTELAGFPTLRVVLRLAGPKPPADREVGRGGPGFLFNNYFEVPAGHGTVELYDAPAPAAGKPELHPLVSLLANFTAGMFFTVLVNEPDKAGTPPRLEMIEDPGHADGLTAEAAQITVRNFMPGLKNVHVSVGDALTAQFASGAGFLVMSGAKPAVYQMQTSGTAPDGKPFEWTNEADFRQYRHQTLLIYPDPYGRIRPRMSVDGERPPAPPEDKDGQR